MSERQTIRALVLSGGSLYGAWQAGVLAAMFDHDPRDFDVIVGVSVGGLAGSFICQAGSDQLATYASRYRDWWWDARSSRDFFRLNPLRILSPRRHRRSIYGNGRLERRVRNEISIPRLLSSGRVLRIGAVRLDDGNYHSFGPEDKFQGDASFHDVIMASTSHVAVFPSVEIDGSLYEDANARVSVPLHEITTFARRHPHADMDIVIVNCRPVWNTPRRRHEVDGFLERLFRSIQIRGMEISHDDVMVHAREIMDVNPDRKIAWTIYQPAIEPVDHPLRADGDEIRRAVAMGINDYHRPHFTNQWT